MAGPDQSSTAVLGRRERPGTLGQKAAVRAPLDPLTSRPRVTIPDTDIERLLDAAYRSLPMVPEGLREQVAGLLTPEAMAVIAGVATVWAGSHFFGVGEVVDVVLAGAAYLAVGWDAIRALRGFVRYYDLAVHAHDEKDLEAAAQAFAEALLAVANAVGWGKLGKWLGKGLRRVVVVENAAAQLARWRHFIDAIKFKVPRNRGMLWSKLGDPLNAERMARQKGLTCLELELKKNGFFTLYEREFGKTQNAITAKIWKWVSERYVQSLEGKVIGYVHRGKHFGHINKSAEKAAKAAGKDADAIYDFKKIINADDPVIVHEVKEISDILLKNPKITEVLLIDVETGEAFGYRTREVLESLQRLEKKPTYLPHLP